MNLETLQEKIKQCDLRPSEIVKMSYGLVTINQAQQWVDFHKTGRNLSAPVVVMLLKMCEDKERGIASMDGDLSKERILSMAVQRDKIVLSGVYFLVNKNEIIYVGQSVKTHSRLLTHWAEKEFDKVFVLQVEKSRLTEVENHYIKKFNPRLNKSNNPNFKFPPREKREFVLINDAKPWQLRVGNNLASLGHPIEKLAPVEKPKYFHAKKVDSRGYEPNTVRAVGDSWLFEYKGHGWKIPKNLSLHEKYCFGDEVKSGDSFRKVKEQQLRKSAYC